MIPRKYDEIIVAAANKYLDFDWRLFKAQLWQESKFDPYAKSPVGALGIGQIMPDTWKMWSVRAGFSGEAITDATANIFTSACYMQWLWKEWSWPRPEMDRFCLAAASYNSGLGDILKAQKIVGDKVLYKDIIKGLPQADPRGSAETIHYVKQILKYYSEIVVNG